jgi:cysteine desulfuration protein SufE
LNIESAQQELIEEFEIFEDWLQKYEYIIDLGKALAPMSEVFKTDENIITGCQSKVWIYISIEDNKMKFLADSDAIITKGLVALLLRVYENKTPQEVFESNENFIEKIGLLKHLSPTRNNGLLSMVKQIKATAFIYSKL